MSNELIFLTGFSAFSLMFIAIVLTVIEFRQLKGRSKDKN